MTAWDDAAPGYDAYWVPRFAPWVAAAVRALPRHLPDGPIGVPCCGTFPELPALAAAHPGREIVGVDLSARMVAMAQERAAAWPQARAVAGDAAHLPDSVSGCAAIVSVFGLQQLPDPADALARWVQALAPGGHLSVVFWPATTETAGPFAAMRRALAAERGPADSAWEHPLRSAAVDAGGEVLRDELVSFPIEHPSAEACFDAYLDSGPLRSARDRGEEFLADLRARFLQGAPAGAWTHHPAARHLVVAA